jgi:hypothetical protein
LAPPNLFSPDYFTPAACISRNAVYLATVFTTPMTQTRYFFGFYWFYATA